MCTRLNSFIFFSGLIYDKTGNFNLAFFVLAAFQFAGGALICIELCLNKFHYIHIDKNNFSQEEEEEKEKGDDTDV